MRRSFLWWLVAALVVVSFPLDGAFAQSQIRPRMLVILDTSGSMLADFPGWATFGDGSIDYPGLDTSGDAEADDSRLYIAKSVMSDIFNSTGDVEFAFADYHNTLSPWVPFGNDCPLVIPAYASNDVAGGCDYYDPYWPDDPLVGGANNRADETADPLTNVWADPISYQGFAARTLLGVCEESPGVQGPGADVLVGFTNDNQNLLISWVDGEELYNAQLTDWAEAGPHSPNDGHYSHELRASGFTPLARSLQSAWTYLNPLYDAEPLSEGRVCRPYYVVMVTDGLDTCENCGCRVNGTTCTANNQCCSSACRDGGGGACGVGETCTCQGANGNTCTSADRQTVPVTRVTELCSVRGDNGAGCDVPTYVIGLALDSPVLDNMAAAGQTGYGAFVANNRDDLAAAFSEIIEGSVLVEVCDGDDNDCDGEVDEGFPLFCDLNSAHVRHPAIDLCADPGELDCDYEDDNCNGLIDEGHTKYCNRPGGHPAQDLCADPGETVCDGIDDNCNGVVDEGVCGGCTPAAEICDNQDNDCDGSIDESLTRACGTDVGVCVAGTERCVAGVWGGCNAVGPGDEVCNNLDDNCDGVIDGNEQACGTDVGECVAGSQRCVAGNWQDCAGGVGPRPESCDTFDNDCDGAVDEGLGGGACGSEVGDCEPGTYACIAGALVCQDEGTGGPEVCDRRDNDCDNLIDEGNPGGGAACGPDTDEGACERGTEVCLDGDIVCQGGTWPSAEICDGLDNDCDGQVDEDNPGGGDACGDDTGECAAGTTNCVTTCDANGDCVGEIICEGAIGPTDEICNTLDDDCDGMADEGLPVGAACGTSDGECEPGVNICQDGEIVCAGGIGPTDEICNGLDDDCDNLIDEGLGLGDECSNEEGQCEPGRWQCADGELVCSDGVLPIPEECNCEDDDCDALVDEDDDMCPPGEACRDCDCVIPCGNDPEFPCPPGRQCVHDVPGDQGWCVGDRCAGVNCPAGEKCDAGQCVPVCEGVDCPNGTRCNGMTGRCVVNDCYNFPEDCAQNESCIDGDCRTSPCSGVTCLDSEYCRDGDCVATCVGIECDLGRQCVDGECVGDRCANVTCTQGRYCDQETAQCADDLCEQDQVDCPVGYVCERATGECIEDPCNVTECPAEQVCVMGVCGLPDDGDDDDDEPPLSRRILATGGGGCDCKVAPQGGADGPFGMVLFVLGLGLVLARRRARHVLGVGLALGAASLVSGCEVDPFCINCGSDAGVPVDAEPDGPHVITYDSGPDSAVDSGVDGGDTCEEGAVELCNGRDDDCDGDIDEGINYNSIAHCGTCENDCRDIIANAIATCDWSGVEGEAGTCGIERCDSGFVDLSDEEPGCEYRCAREADDDAVCNFRDDDCDGETDEDVDGLTDPQNCGVDLEGDPVCGRGCAYAHGIGECVGGECGLAGCDPDYYDRNLDAGDGCEVRCTDPTEDVCNGLDDDCDGETDEGDPGGGVACGTEVGLCETGTTACVAGVVECEGGVLADTETCNAFDDDCDGDTDENNPGGGISCGESEGDCVAGVLTCQGGVLVCVGAVGEVPETCDGRDNDCDGTPDDGNPGAGGACGTDTGACVAGTDQCQGGQIVCVGAQGPTLESCNDTDDDCDGQSDEDFDKQNSIVNCGQCGTVCSFPNAVAGCVNGACQQLGCLPGFFDLRQGVGFEGCEFGPCQLNGNEICNGVDDDCDNSIDEGLVAPQNFCNANGVCAGEVATCGGALGWTCNYPGPGGGTYQGGGETLCDGLDNDCDGATDEPFPNKGTECDNGALGTCRRTGVFVCNAQQNGLRCNAALPPPPGVEACNGQDDDCDGAVDESIALVDMNAVHITSGAPDFWIFEYEASRPDAELDDAGLSESRACSNPDVLPWTDVTEIEAEAACCALNSLGCRGVANEWRLCGSDLWERACQTDALNTYPYGDVYGAATCNGNDWDCDGVTAGDQDCLYAAGSFAACTADWDAAGNVFDLSGNVKEWTSTERPAGSGVHEIRGGAYNNAPGGLTCDFDFTLASAAFNFQNLGFRCCYYE